MYLLVGRKTLRTTKTKIEIISSNNLITNQESTKTKINYSPYYDLTGGL